MANKLNLKKLLTSLFSDILTLKIFTKRSMEDPEKIHAKIVQLSGGPLRPIVWQVIDGTLALTEVKGAFNGERKQFNPSRGIPVKAFIHLSTGEMKIFPAKMFEQTNAR